MCLLVLAVMLLLFFYLSASIELYQLSEVIDEVNIPLSQGWDVLITLWPALAFMFFAGVFTVLIVMKFWRRAADSE